MYIVFAMYIYIPCFVRVLVAQKNVDRNYSYLLLIVKKLSPKPTDIILALTYVTLYRTRPTILDLREEASSCLPEFHASAMHS